MRLSLLLLVAATAIVATLGAPVAASDAKAVNAVNPTNVHEVIALNRFLRAHKEEDILVNDEEDEEEKDDDDEEERMFLAVADKARAAYAAAKLAGKSGDDLIEAVTKLDKSEVNALFTQGKSHVANLVPDFRPGMSLDDFVAAMKSAGLSDDVESVLMVGYSKYLAHNMRG